MTTLPFAPRNMRLGHVEDEPGATPAAEDPIEVLLEGEADVEEMIDPENGIISVKLPDGTVEISLGALKAPKKEGEEEDFDENLAERIDEFTLNSIASDLLQAIAQDDASRSEWLADRAQGIKLLGLKVEEVKGGTQAPLEGMSTVRHPLLLEAVVRFQANARAELLPTDGPVKVRNDDATPELGDDALATALQKDFNHFLTTTAKEYYPDTDRMLFMVGFSGCQFRKVYHCPIRRRPVAETVDASDLIVSNASVDLDGCGRITQRVIMRPSILKRLQLSGHYLNIPLSDANLITPTPADQAVEEQQGVQPAPEMNPVLREREIYECYTELDLPGFEHKDKDGAATGLPLPYRVTIDRSSEKVLEIRRNWRAGDEQMLPRRVFVKYSFVPALGFYDIGLLHILGNTTSALTMAWRLMLDAGQFANFPGFLYSKKSGAKQDTNLFRVAPGAGVPIETGDGPIGQAVMPLPYKEPGQGLMNLVGNIAETGARLGGTAEIAVGEGRQDAPVGTTIALVEQATKILNAVHKRMHAAQAEEFQLLRECFKEDPESFWRGNGKPARDWDDETLVKALEDADLVPVADPNTSSEMLRVMKALAVHQIATATNQVQPGIYDMREVNMRVMQMLKVESPQGLFLPVVPPGPNPQDQMAREAIAIKAKEADAKMLDAMTGAREAEIEAINKERELADREAQRKSEETIAAMELGASIAVHPDSADEVAQILQIPTPFGVVPVEARPAGPSV